MKPWGVAQLEAYKCLKCRSVYLVRKTRRQLICPLCRQELSRAEGGANDVP